MDKCKLVLSSAYTLPSLTSVTWLALSEEYITDPAMHTVADTMNLATGIWEISWAVNMPYSASSAQRYASFFFGAGVWEMYRTSSQTTLGDNWSFVHDFRFTSPATLKVGVMQKTGSNMTLAANSCFVRAHKIKETP